MADLLHNASTGYTLENFITYGDLLKNDNLIEGEIYKRYDESIFLQLLEAKSSWMLTKDSTVHWHEDGFVQNNAKVGSLSGGASNGASATITLANSSHYEGGTRSPFNPNKLVKVNGTFLYIQSKNTSVNNAHTLTVVPAGTNASNIQINQVVNSGDTIIPVANFYAERTGYDLGEQNKPELLSEKLGIVKNKVGISGSQAANELKEKIEINDGRYWTYKMEKDLFLQHRLELNLASWISPGGTVTDGSGNTVQVPKGFIKQLEERGNVWNYFGNETITDLYTYVRILSREHAPKINIMCEGIDASIGKEQYITDVMSQNATQYLQNSKDGKDMLDFGFSGYTVSGYTFVRNNMPDFNHSITTAAPGQNYTNYTVIMPFEKRIDRGSKKQAFDIRLGYRKVESGNQSGSWSFDRKYQFHMNGDAVPSQYNSSEIDQYEARYLTEVCPVIVGAHRGIVAKPA